MTIFPITFSTFKEYEVVKVKDYKLVKKIEIIDTKTLDRYKKLSMFDIARKAMFVFLFSPALLTLKVTFNLLQIAFDCTAYFFTYFTMAKSLAMGAIDFFQGNSLVNKNITNVFEISISSRVDFFKHISQDVIYIARAPFFTIAMQLAAIFTLVCPDRGRKAIAKIERSWNYDMGLSYNYRNNEDFKKRPLIIAIFNTLFNRKENVVFYLAPCFQPGSLNDKHIIYPLKEDF